MSRVRTNVIVDGHSCWCLFDTGARNTYVIQDVASLLPTIELDKPEPVALGGRTYQIRRESHLTCLVEGLPVRTHARVLEEIGTDEEGKRIEVLLGALAMQEWGISPVPDLPAPRPNTFYVYAIICDNNSIYIGQTNNLRRRWKEHCVGEVDWTKRHRPIKIVHYEEFGSRKEAVRREHELKTGFGREWLKRQIKSGRARQAGEERLDMSNYPKEFVEFMVKEENSVVRS